MERFVSLALVLIGWPALALAHEPAAGGGRLEGLAWMAGSWSGEAGGTTSEEHWTRPAGGLMLGLHRDVRGERARFEYLRIVEDGEGIVYLGSPQGREPTPFRLVELAPGRAVFANPEHDFPQRILYWREGEDLCAAVEGPPGGDESRQQWCWRPSALRPAGAAGRAEGGAADAEAPAWYHEHNEFLVRDGGVFHTDNSAYRSEAEPWDAYGLAWERGPSRQTVRGRLFGLKDGEDAGTFWEFWIFWHPGEGKAFMYQVGGDGTLGVGTLEPPAEDGSQRSEATFHRPDGGSSRVAHDIRNRGDVHATASFDWVDGAWKPRRTYVWHRVREGQGEGQAGGDGSSEP